MKRLAFAAAMSALLAAALAGPAAAVWDDTDIVHWRVWKPGKHALMMLKATDTGMELSAAVEGLTAGAAYRIIGTDDGGGCASAVNSSNRTFSFNVVAGGAQDDTYFRGNATDDLWKTTAFIRIRRVGGNDWACAAAKHYGLTADPHDLTGNTFVFGDGSLRAIVSIEQLPNGTERMSVAAGDFNNDSPIDVVVRASNRRCGTSGAIAAELLLEDLVRSRFATRTINISQAQLDGLRSIRIITLHGSTDQDWFGACRKSILVALLLP